MYGKEVKHMTIVKYKNQSGVTYAYEQTSNYIPESKQSRPIRKYLGRVDPETGEIISTKGKRGRPPKKKDGEKPSAEAAADFRNLYEDASRELETVKRELREKEEENRKLKESLESLRGLLTNMMNQIDTSQR